MFMILIGFNFAALIQTAVSFFSKEQREHEIDCWLKDTYKEEKHENEMDKLLLKETFENRKWYFKKFYLEKGRQSSLFSESSFLDGIFIFKMMSCNVSEIGAKLICRHVFERLMKKLEKRKDE